jgi:hypothetical protein
LAGFRKSYPAAHILQTITWFGRLRQPLAAEIVFKLVFQMIEKLASKPAEKLPGDKSACSQCLDSTVELLAGC